MTIYSSQEARRQAGRGFRVASWAALGVTLALSVWSGCGSSDDSGSRLGGAPAGDAGVPADAAAFAESGSSVGRGKANADAAIPAPSPGAAADGADAGGGLLLDTDVGCARWAERRCERWSACASGSFDARFSSTADCVADATTKCATALAVRDSGWSLVGLVRCSRQLEEVGCGDWLVRRGMDACVPTGARIDGMPCADPAQCHSGFCAADSTAACGVCSPRAAAGASCRADDQCLPGLLCAGAAGQQICAVPVALGGACDRVAAPCEPSLVCAEGACLPPLSEGEACNDDDACDARAGLACRPEAGGRFCRAVRFAQPGEACGVLNEGPVLCRATDAENASALCLASSNGPGRCAVRPTEGQPCEDAGPACAVGSTCDRGVCRVPTACR